MNHNQAPPAWLQDEEEKLDRKPLSPTPQSASLASVGSVAGAPVSLEAIALYSCYHISYRVVH